jgi:hypothetical protein
MEVKKDKELQKKIEENSPLSVPEIIGNAEERLEKEEAAADAADKAIQEEFEKLTADDVDPLFEAETPSGGGGGSSVPTYNLTVTKEFYDANRVQQVATREVTSQNLPQNGEYSISLVPPTGYAFDSITGDNNATTTNDTFVGVMDTNKNILIQYSSLTEIHLSSPTVTQVNAAYSGGYQTVYVDGTVSIDPNNPNDITINLGNGNALHFNGNASRLSNGVNLATVAGSTVTVDEGTFTNNGSIAGQGTMTVQNGATLNNSGRIDIASTNSLHVQGDLINNNAIYVGAPVDNVMKAGLLSVEGTGKFTNAGTLVISADSSVTIESNSRLINNNGTVTNNGEIVNDGTIQGTFGNSLNPTSGTLINNGTMDPTDELYSMVMDSSNKIIAWRTAANLFMGNWIANATHTLVGSQNLYDNGPNDAWYNDWDSSALNAQGVTLDLNGRILTLPQIFLIEGGSLTITDSTKNASGKIIAAETSDFTGSNSSLISVQYGGSLTLNSGTLENNSVSTDGIATGTAVQVGDPDEDDASIVNTFIMNDGILVSNSTAVDVAGGSSFTLNDGTVEADYAALYVSSGASFVMTGGEVISTRDTAISLYGTFTMDGGTVTGYTNGIYSYSADPSVNITLNKGTVKIENTAAGVQYPYGAAIMVCYYYSEGASENDPPVLSCPVIQINNVTYSPESETCEAVAGSGIKLYIPCDENKTTLQLDDVLLGGKLVTYYVDEEVGSVSLTPAIAITNLEI